jgi:phosphatidylglycerol:prolipoprotein diacylglycerol transferase
MMPILNIGPLAIQLPGLLLLLGIWLGLSLSEKYAKRQGINPNTIYNLVFIGLISGAVTARLAYVVRYPAVFSSAPLGVFSLNPGLLDPWGGLAGGLIAALIYGQRKNLPFWSTMDAITPLLSVFSISMSLSNLASGAGFGAPTDLFWGIYLWGAVRHPSQVYESVAATLILVIFWPTRNWKNSIKPGVYFLLFIALSSATRLFLEAFRGDSLILLGGIRQTQVIAWLLMALSLWYSYKLQNKQNLFNQSSNNSI